MVCDLFLLNVGMVRLYLEVLKVQDTVVEICQWPWSHAVMYLEPLLVGILSANQLFVLLLTIDQVEAKNPSVLSEITLTVWPFS